VSSAAQAANDSLQVLLEGQISGLDTRLSSVEAYEARIAALETQLTAALDLIADLQTSLAPLDPSGELVELANHVMVDDSTINGLVGLHVIFHGANVHVQNGSTQTYSVNGLGNLIVGYNEVNVADPANRTGSHNLVVSVGHEYTSYGGFVTGINNKIIAPHASISGGSFNEASGHQSSVSGGSYNEAGETNSSVSGGERNKAYGIASWVGGGRSNMASGSESSVIGGWANTASGNYSSVSGGFGNRASGLNSSVSGGANNEPREENSSISGGIWNVTSGNSSSISGGNSNTASGIVSSVSGGFENTADHYGSTISGGYGLTTTFNYEHLP
jgi:hypothetical protein